MDNSMQILKYFIIGVGAVFAILVIVFLALRKKMMGKNTRYIAELTKGTKEKSFSMEVFYQKFYIQAVRIPGLKRYALKLRRRLEIINLEDEYLTRKQTAKIFIKGVIVVVPLLRIVSYSSKPSIVP